MHAVLALAMAASPAALAAGPGLRSGLPDKSVLHFAAACLGREPQHPVELYARGGWYVTEDLAREMRARPGNIEAIAMVWRLGLQPRAVYQWNHDDEFDRDVVACLAPDGRVTRERSRYTPGDSELGEDWIYVHTLAAPRLDAPAGGHYTDRDGRPRAQPRLTAEDRDFIAGERVYRTWNDFDYAGLLGAQEH